jgi:hypothetical protein
MDSCNSGGLININTIDTTKVGTYNLKLIGTMIGYPTVTDFLLFTVNVQDTCLSTVINKVAIATP